MRNGTIILKFFLHVSKEEQKDRFLERIETPEKNWKFSLADVKERGHWDEYMKAYEEMLEHTGTEWAPWYVIPADRKWFTRALVARIIIETLEGLDLQYPALSEKQKAELTSAKRCITPRRQRSTINSIEGNSMKQMLVILCAAVLLAGCGSSKPDVAAGGPPKPPEKKEGPKPYAEVITKEAKSDSGMFIAHRIKLKLFYEIPVKELGKEYLLVTSQEKVQTGLGYGGDNLNYQVVRWERSGDRVILRSILYASTAPDSLPDLL